MSSPSVPAPGQLVQDLTTCTFSASPSSGHKTPETILYQHYLTTLDDHDRNELVQRERDSGLDTPTFAALTMSAFPFEYFEGLCRHAEDPKKRNESGCSPNKGSLSVIEEAVYSYEKHAPETNNTPHGRANKLNGFMAFRCKFALIIVL